MNDTERPVQVESFGPSGDRNSHYHNGKVPGEFTLFVDPKGDRLGVRDANGGVYQVPLSEVAELIRGKVS